MLWLILELRILVYTWQSLRASLRLRLKNKVFKSKKAFGRLEAFLSFLPNDYFFLQIEFFLGLSNAISNRS
jgi:hypothetical protein